MHTIGRKKLKIISIRIFFFIAVQFSLISFSLAAEEVKPLLSTNWGQWNEFAKYAPENRRVGCWSTAFGQILYYHRLFPRKGRIHYECSSINVSIEEDLSEYEVDETKLPTSLDEVARYLYAISVIIQKDFGTGSYVLKHLERANSIQEYFDCSVKLYANMQHRDLNALIKSEIDNNRPVLIHLRDKIKSSYHAAVVDGYKVSLQTYLFHINMGRVGRDNDWFRLDREIEGFDDISYRKVITIKPK